MERPNQRRARKVAAVIVLAMGVFLLVERGTLLQRGLATEQWPEVQGQLLQAEFTKVSSGRVRPGWRMILVYRYEVDGRSFESSWIRRNEPSRRLNSEEREQAEARFDPGSAISVYYNPEQPDQAVIETGFGRRAWLGVLLGLFMLAVAAIFWLVPTRVVKQE